ncbi:MAG TPA: SHOCT domain-containing protein [Dehalococcoidia bacterium]|nr:SHOCT domain-containing protein [Dehalococcoidia bacterium]
MWEMHDGWGWWMMFGWLWFVLFWGAIVALIVWAVNRVGEGASGRGRRDPLEIAKERLAKGEISEEEFQRLKQHLT